MWQISAVYLVMLFVILVFGIISLPIRHKKVRPFHDGSVAAEGATTHSVRETSNAGLQQAAMGKVPPAYLVDQKISSVPQQSKVS